MEAPKSPVLIAFDVDGTLTESKEQITGEMSALLCALLRHKKVAIISGASLGRFRAQILNFLQCVTPNMQEVSNLILLPTNGSQCYTFEGHDWKLVDEEPLMPEIKERIMTALTTVIADPAYDIPTDHTGEYIEDRGTQITFSALGQEAPHDAKAAWDPDHAKRDRIKAALDAVIGDIAEVTIAGTTSIDIVQKGFTKATGLTRLITRLAIPSSEVIFVGDSVFPGGNDYSVKEAGIETVAVTGPSETTAFIQSKLG